MAELSDGSCGFALTSIVKALTSGTG